MKITVIEYGGTKHHINCKSFEFRTNQVENWIRIKYQDGSKEKIHGVATIKADNFFSAPTVEAIPKANVYKAIQEMMKYEHDGFINISLARLDEILKKCGVSE